MKILYYKSDAGNFGDDLNAVMWQQLLPSGVFEDDDTLLMGIGSIFNSEQAPSSATRGKRMFVLGSGAGYGPLPAGWREWSVLAVRGPLTAQLIGRPDLAATDAAALLAVLPRIVTLGPERSLTLFIPHHHSMNHGQWKRVAENAGLTFVDPRWDLPEIMSCFSKAKLVVTEAMHGAIIADTLRTPWIPVNTSPDVLPFKWKDWTLSVNVPYKPKSLPASSFWERHHHRFLARAARAKGLTATGLLKDVQSQAFLVQDFLQRYGNTDSTSTEISDVLGDTPQATHSIRRPLRRWHATIQMVGATLDPLFVENAARHLAQIAIGTSYLSDDSIFASRVEHLQQATYELVKAIRG